MPRIGRSRYVVFYLIAAGGCLVDLATKSWIFGKLGYDPGRDPIWVWRDVLSLETHLNEGALLGFGEGYAIVFSLLSILAALGIQYWLFWAGAARDRLLTLTLACITGGILGNLYDRLGAPNLHWRNDGQWHEAGQRVYAVRDWIHFKIDLIDWPIFNITDSLLVVGAGLLVWHAMRGEADSPRAEKIGEAPVEA